MLCFHLHTHTFSYAVRIYPPQFPSDRLSSGSMRRFHLSLSALLSSSELNVVYVSCSFLSFCLHIQDTCIISFPLWSQPLTLVAGYHDGSISTSLASGILVSWSWGLTDSVSLVLSSQCPPSLPARVPLQFCLFAPATAYTGGDALLPCLGPLSSPTQTANVVTNVLTLLLLACHQSACLPS